MRRLVCVSLLLLAPILLVSSCGGDDDGSKNQKAALTEGDKKDKQQPPTGQEAPRVGAPGEQACGEVFNAAWKNEPGRLDDTVKKSEDIVVGEVESVQKGEDIVVEAKGEPGGQDRIPTTEVKIKVTKAYKGDKKAGDTVSLFQTGDSCRTVDGDPPYKKGETHLLFLEKGPRGLERTTSPEGRFKQKDDGTLEPVVETAATQEVKGKKVKDVEQKLKNP